MRGLFLMAWCVPVELHCQDTVSLLVYSSRIALTGFFRLHRCGNRLSRSSVEPEQERAPLLQERFAGESHRQKKVCRAAAPAVALQTDFDIPNVKTVSTFYVQFSTFPVISIYAFPCKRRKYKATRHTSLCSG
ncbi:hypothetical protein TGPRC2_201785 [Toxoplasma gondii TgCatPRC2]|uniref:Uncharacterized protein n=9 Tax=Toxoplasma gondii TaxID=5811 RepID=V4ZCR5_TOXGV|nr:hypothetical protein TGVEG_201785 [Toxoplasma gondii VEG]KFG41096.1 hypothetical protein TGDOM2_201785 [Toxoplasma gondii GAB2-2007-GAL-DOM2]KFG45398.1 hypothetical protein TGP89_201785 [Toxoplasma gondii p89]KFG53560.1 hypothetical protein TGFOU_201785 [Toxoplasma gondii FOU]KFG62063.1 hypothetical protein TGRUB_201785 [Toxoplasma gondii RUB]KFH06925.1 hypothetical protein TGVAND_201785 [Toxoplasma gondii VAND]KYK66609.1 hypothetical protein TGPRC2_201785 [Toxoplasma gondii TgCatPRC2]PUA